MKISFFSVLTLILLNNIAFTQQIESRVENSLIHRIIKAYEAGEIDFSSMIKNRIYAITNPDQIDDRFKIDGPIIEKCATANVLELRDVILKQQVKDLSSDITNGFLGILTRVTKQKNLVSPSGKFRIHYDTIGTHAVYQPTVDVNPADGHPDYVNRCAEIFDYVYDIEINQMGYTPPPPDGTSGGGTNQYDVYMHKYSGAYGVTFSDGPVFNYGTPPRTAYKSYIYVDPTYDGFGYSDRTLPLKVTAAHEFFHAIQFAYNINAGNWFMEISSTWIEDIVYDAINDYRYYLSAFFNSPQTSLTKFDGSHEYASCIYGHYISENFGNDRLKRIWDFTVNAGTNIALNAIENALNEIGTNSSVVFSGFTVWNYLTGSRANGTHPTYSEGAFFPQVNIAATYSSYPVSTNSPSGHEFLATFYYHFNPISSPSNLKLGFNQITSSLWKGKVVIDSANRFKSFDVDLSGGTGIYDLLSFNNKTRAVFIPANVASSGTNLSYSYTANMLLLPTVLYPNGGEVLYIDSSYNITWNAQGISNLKIEYTTDNGISWLTIAPSIPATNGSYSWIVPSTPTNFARVKITSTADTNLFDVSNNVFSIQHTPTITILSPNDSEIFPVGFLKNIQWSFVNLTGNVKIELTRDGGLSYETLFENTLNDGSQEWLITSPVTEQAKIKISSLMNPLIFDTSDAYFYIREATITVLKPNGGEDFRVGLQDTIKWLSENMEGNVKIELSRNGGLTYETIFENIDNNGYKLWIPSVPLTALARIRITALGNNNVFDESDSNFLINPQDFISLEKPQFGQSLLIGNTYEIKWSSFGTSGNVKIELSKDGGNNFETLIENTPDDGTELWIPAFPTSHKCLMKISDVSNNNLYGVSGEFLVGVYDSLRYSLGWNLMSLSGYVTDRKKTIIFPDAKTNAFEFNSGYYVVDTLNYGKAYWIKFSQDSFSVNISSPRMIDTILVNSGWNLIGGISVPVNIADIITEPSDLISSLVYMYQSGYRQTDSIYPGKGVWLKANQNGKLIFSASSKNKFAAYDNFKLPQNLYKIEIIDADNNREFLYWIQDHEIKNIEFDNELPPKPPLGIFDLRFNSNRIVESLNSDFVSISIQDAKLPLVIKNLSNDMVIKLILNGSEYTIPGQKEFTIRDDINEILVKPLAKGYDGIPETYELHQNYPNPFNPTTIIKYSLPVDCYVVLKVFNVLGNEVTTLVSEFKKAGFYEVKFESEDKLSNGVYYYQLIAGNFVSTKKAILLK